MILLVEIEFIRFIIIQQEYSSLSDLINDALPEAHPHYYIDDSAYVIYVNGSAKDDGNESRNEMYYSPVPARRIKLSQGGLKKDAGIWEIASKRDGKQRTLCFMKKNPIIDGHDYSSCFLIMPVPVIDCSDTNHPCCVTEMQSAEISVEECDAKFILPLREKHFDDELRT